MMQLLTAGGLGREFRGSADAAAYHKFFARQQEEQRLRRERAEELRSDNAEFLDAAISVISTSDISDFKVELDLYDTATVTALQEKNIALEHVSEQLNPFLAKAHVLPDGRRVFKTEDGQRVFDEHGDELDAQTIEPDEIGDEKPYWEQVEPLVREQHRLIEERAELIRYQAKLDDARERLDAGDLTRAEFEETRETLKADMPDAVRGHVPGMEAKDTPSAAIVDVQPDELEFSDDLVPTPLASRPSIPTFSG